MRLSLWGHMMSPQSKNQPMARLIEERILKRIVLLVAMGVL